MRNSRHHLENVINSGVRGRTSSSSVFSCFLRSALSYSMGMLTTSSITLEWSLWCLKSAVITDNLLTNPRSTTCRQNSLQSSNPNNGTIIRFPASQLVSIRVSDTLLIFEYMVPVMKYQHTRYGIQSICLVSLYSCICI